MLKQLTRIVLSFLMAFLFLTPAFALPPVEQDGNTAILAGANTISLGGSFSHVIVWLSSSSSSVYFTFNQQAATTSNCLLDGGSTISYGLAGFASAIPTIRYYGNGTTGTISWMAW